MYSTTSSRPVKRKNGGENSPTGSKKLILSFLLFGREFLGGGFLMLQNAVEHLRAFRAPGGELSIRLSLGISKLEQLVRDVKRRQDRHFQRVNSKGARRN